MTNTDTHADATTNAQMDAQLEAEQARDALFSFKPTEVDEALSELEREGQVRERCFPKWVAEGRLSRIDARDRLDRQLKAVNILKTLLTALPAVQ